MKTRKPSGIVLEGSLFQSSIAMERQIILDALAGSLDSNPQLRKQAEGKLAEFEKQPGFTVYCLELAVDSEVSSGQRSSAAVFFKNRVAGYWNVQNDKGIKLEEQEQIKQRLIESMLKVYNDSHIRPQLSVALRSIIGRDSWQLNDPILQLLNSKSDPSHVYIGLLLLFEVTRSLRFSSADRTLIDSYISQTFPILESIASEVLQKNDYHSGDILYLILKIFKYSCLYSLPQYFFDINKLSNWISIHLSTIQRDVPEKILEVDPLDRALDKRIKCYKWAFGNLQIFYARYAMPTSKNSSPEFIQYFNKNYVPEILKIYFQIIEKWSSGFWLSDFSLYHLITFLEKCIMTEAWDLIKPHFDIILKHLLFRCLCQENLELFDEDPEEYIRRFFDVNRESKTADVAAVDALFVTVHHRFEELPIILTFLMEVFNSNDQSEQYALKIEGGLRILSSISISLEKKDSPVKDQIDQIIDGLVVPHLTSNFEFLRARSCETISIFARTFEDKTILSKVYQGVYENFKNDNNLPIQIEAADALSVLITDPLVTETISNEVPLIMQKLLNLSRTYELDMIAEVMESFVQRFSKELEPFAVDLGKNLVEQFIRTATEILEIQSQGKRLADTSDADKEYQAVGYLNTMTTMIISMPKVDLEPVFLPVIQFVLHNAAIAFLGEAMELAESITMNSKKISPSTWEIFKETTDSFDTFAFEYFEYFVPFYENVITYGFRDLNKSSPQVQLLSDIINKLVSSPATLDDNGAFELVEYQTLALHEVDDVNYPIILHNFKEEDLAPFSIIKVSIACLYVDPTKTLQILEQRGETLRIFEIWFNLSSSFENVYGLKLQILALLSILSLDQLPQSIESFIPQLANKLTLSIQRLPLAMKKRQDLLKTDTNKAFEEEYEEDGFDDDFDDAFKDTPLDEINVFIEFKKTFLEIQSRSNGRYQTIIQSLPQERLNVIQGVLSLP